MCCEVPYRPTHYVRNTQKLVTLKPWLYVWFSVIACYRCGYEFCYTCGKEWKEKKATCSCSLWEERNIIDDDSEDDYYGAEEDGYYDEDYDNYYGEDYDDYYGEDVDDDGRHLV